ncbi:MAG: multiprotein-bridging factor 1 family protein [Solirubrobacterales bacterium]
MRSADLLVAGRRRAGLSQEQLASRLGRTQSTIARWESGYQRPPLESVVEALHACGLELTVGMARYDDSYESLIAGQLLLEPVERVRRLARRTTGFDPIGLLSELAKDARFVVIGKVAGAFNGWPIVLGTPVLHVVPAESSADAIERAARRLGAEAAGEGEDGAQRWVLASGAELHVSAAPRGTHGYRDLARDAQRMQIAPELSVQVASLIDLIRIAEASTGPDGRTFVPALWATLETRQRWAKDSARPAA